MLKTTRGVYTDRPDSLVDVTSAKKPPTFANISSSDLLTLIPRRKEPFVERKERLDMDTALAIRRLQEKARRANFRSQGSDIGTA